MDIFRLPKFSYYFYRSQRDAGETGSKWTGGPVVFIASHWTPASALRVTIYSNCDEIALHLNGQLIRRGRPVQSALTQHLPHPPFYFDLERFEPGRLTAVGYLGGDPVTNHTVATPGPPARLELSVDDAAVDSTVSEPDVLCVHAQLCDATGVLCAQETLAVAFHVAGGEVIGPASLAAEAGIASFIVRISAPASGFTATATIPARNDIPPATVSWHRQR
jgi:beta-galactosidase